MNDVLYKIKTEDGWMQIEKNFYNKMIDYMKNNEDAFLYDFLDKYAFWRMIRFIKNEEKATIFEEYMIHAIIDNDIKFYPLQNFSEYYVVDQYGNINKFEN